MPLSDLLLAGGLNKALGLIQHYAKYQKIERTGKLTNSLIKKLQQKLPPQTGDTYEHYRQLLRRAATAHNSARDLMGSTKALAKSRHTVDPLLSRGDYYGFGYKVLVICDDEEGNPTERYQTTIKSSKPLTETEIADEIYLIAQGDANAIKKHETSPKGNPGCAFSDFIILAALRTEPTDAPGPLPQEL